MDKVTHLFDYMELAKSFHFYEGQAFFTSHYYDANNNYYFLKVPDQDMTKSLVFMAQFMPIIPGSHSGISNRTKTRLS